MAQKPHSKATGVALADNPLEGEQLLLDALFGGREASPAPRRPVPALRSVEKPQHYKIVSISLYMEDLARLDEMVRELKRRGHYKANKSQLIRLALAQLDLDALPVPRQ